VCHTVTQVLYNQEESNVRKMTRDYLLKELKQHKVSRAEVDYVIAFGFEFAIEVNPDL